MVLNANLGIPTNRHLWSIAIGGDDLIWTSGEGEIRKINIPKAKTGGYDSAQEEDMYLLLRGPHMAPLTSYHTDGTSPTNLLGLGIILLVSRKEGRMVHCSAYCPIGTIVNLTRALYKGKTLVDVKEGFFGLAFDASPDQGGKGKLRYWRDSVEVGR